MENGKLFTLSFLFLLVDIDTSISPQGRSTEEPVCSAGVIMLEGHAMLEEQATLEEREEDDDDGEDEDEEPEPVGEDEEPEPMGENEEPEPVAKRRRME